MASAQKIWIVDDDPIARLLIRKTIEHFGGFDEIEEMQHGRELVDKLKEYKENGWALPYIILLDLNMPVMDGWEFLDYWREHDEPLVGSKIVVLTSSINPADEEKAKDYEEVVGFTHKPLTAEALRKFI